MSVMVGMACSVATDVIMRTGAASAVGPRRANDWRHVATGCSALVDDDKCKHD